MYNHKKKTFVVHTDGEDNEEVKVYYHKSPYGFPFVKHTRIWVGSDNYEHCEEELQLVYNYLNKDGQCSVQGIMAPR